MTHKTITKHYVHASSYYEGYTVIEDQLIYVFADEYSIELRMTFNGKLHEQIEHINALTNEQESISQGLLWSKAYKFLNKVRTQTSILDYNNPYKRDIL